MPTELESIARILLAFLLGGAIGLERERRKKPAGLRTHILVCMGSALFTLIGLMGFPGADPARVASYLVVGIGFIGAGCVLHQRGKIAGLTTAASLWVTTAIGMATGIGSYFLAVLTTALTFVVLELKSIES